MKTSFLVWCSVVALGLSGVGNAPRASGVEAGAPSARRILFLGDSITYGGLYVEYCEAFLRLRYPDWPGQVMNLGLPSETVSGLSEAGHAGGAFPRPDLHERLERVLNRVKPDLVIACYGINDGIYLPFDAERFKRFQAGILELRRKVAAAGANIVHLTPPTYDPVAAKASASTRSNYNDVLDRYSEWLLSKRAEGWTVLDVHGPMNHYLSAQRQKEPAYQLAGDGVHPNETGHWLIARPLILYFGGATNLAAAESVNTMLDAYPRGPAVLKRVQQQQRLLKDAWLTETGHQRPGMKKGLPMAEAERQAAELKRFLESTNSL